MGKLQASNHASIRMAQRSIRFSDLELVALAGTEVDDGFLMRQKDCDNLCQVLRQTIDRLKNLKGHRVVLKNGVVVTTYRASKNISRRLLRNAEERGLSWN